MNFYIIKQKTNQSTRLRSKSTIVTCYTKILLNRAIVKERKLTNMKRIILKNFFKKPYLKEVISFLNKFFFLNKI